MAKKKEEKKDKVEELIAQLKDKDKEVRYTAAEALGKIGDKRAVPALIEALKDKDENVRWKSAYALGDLGDKKAVPPLIETLKNKGEEWLVRDAAAGVLGCELGDKRAIPALIEALKDESKEVRSSALMPLDILLEDMTITIKDKRVVPTLIEILKDKDEDGEDQDAAASVLGKLGDERAIPALVDHLKAVSETLNADVARDYCILKCIWALSDLVNKLKKIKSKQKKKNKI